MHPTQETASCPLVRTGSNDAMLKVRSGPVEIRHPVKLTVHPNRLNILLANFCGRKDSTTEKLNLQMESFTQLLNKDYVQYQHTDPFRFSRWTARESFQYMHSRPWHQILDFYSNVVNGSLTLSTLFGFKACHVHDAAEISECLDETKLEMISPKERSGRWARVTFKVILSYHGDSFDGWQKQPGLNTVQGLVERSLGIFVDENKMQQLKDKSLPIEGRAEVAGRTDKGVTAIGQVCSFYTWRKDVKTQEIEDAINSAAPGKLRVNSVSKVSRAFHPNFSANWRRYLYIFPFNDEEDEEQITHSGENAENHKSDIHNEQKHDHGEYENEVAESFTDDCQEEQGNGTKPQTFSVNRVNQLLQQLEGKLLSYKMFARDTKASRNIGPPTECFLYHARATEARLPSLDCIEGRKVMCVELVANRFLRKMVRVLVATAVREAAAGAEEDSLLKLMDATCRRATAPPAPPYGLSLVDVGYVEFNENNCFIPKE